MNAAFGKPSQKEEEKPFLLDIAPIGGDPPTEIYLDTFSKVKKLPKKHVARETPCPNSFLHVLFLGQKQKWKSCLNCVERGEEGVIRAIPKRKGCFCDIFPNTKVFERVGDKNVMEVVADK